MRRFATLILRESKIAAKAQFIGLIVSILAALIYGLLTSPVRAHDEWANGAKIPSWVKASCCGPADAHHLRPEQVHRISDDYYQVDGYIEPIAVSHALPSQDGDYWIFYRGEGKDESGVYCFFVPMAF